MAHSYSRRPCRPSSRLQALPDLVYALADAWQQIGVNAVASACPGVQTVWFLAPGSENMRRPRAWGPRCGGRSTKRKCASLSSSRFGWYAQQFPTGGASHCPEKQMRLNCDFAAITALGNSTDGGYESRGGGPQLRSKRRENGHREKLKCNAAFPFRPGLVPC